MAQAYGRNVIAEMSRGDHACSVAAKIDEARAHFAQMLAIARDRAADLGDGPVRTALSGDFFEGIEERLAGDVSGWSTWPPLFVFAADERGERLADLDGALTAVAEYTRSDKRDGMNRWLLADDGDRGTRMWRSGIFELAMKARFLASASDVEFDALLPNGRDVDIRATIAGRQICFEATAITESDEDQGVWARFMTAKAGDEDAVLVRPGEHDNADANGPSPYYDCARVYLKVFDKLSKNWDPARSQTSGSDPNVILLSIWTGYGMPYTSSPGIGWALDELFADQPNAGAIKQMTRPGVSDVSLATFLNREAPAVAHELIKSPRRLGAVVTFAETRLDGGRVNYNAFQANQISHPEMVAIEAIASFPLSWA
jgi:hypothetical protein